MANTYTLIGSSTAGSSGSASFDFTSIPSTYTDLVLEFSVRTDYGSTFDGCLLRINGDTGANYSIRNVRGAGGGTITSAGSSGATNLFVGSIPGVNATSSVFQNAVIYFPNYAGSSNKSLLIDSVSENNNTTAYTLLAGGLWSNTNAITSLKLYPEVGTVFVQYSTAYLYGVKNS